uniref:Uncharacterized protein n=1 Tax=Bos indicus x Bos taurus TaxID=30522 RepID=A0A4W2BTZ3_BOBOX
METQRASLSLGRWSLWLLLLGLVLPSASAQALSYREAMLRAVDQLNERVLRSSSLPPPGVEDLGARKPVNFRVKETVCPRSNLQPPEQCDFKENGVSLGTETEGGLWNMLRTDDPLPHPGQRKALLPGPLPPPSPRSPALALHPLEQCFCNAVPTPELT